jgi:hypothetical protein
MPDTKFVSVYAAEGQLAGEMIRVLFESFGIPAILSQESVAHTYGLTAGPVGQVFVLVPEDQVSDATQILESMDRGDLELPDDEADDSNLNKDFDKTTD